MKQGFIRVLLAGLMMLAPPVVADESQVADDLNSIKRSVLELNRDLYELEENLLSPATTRAELYLSLSHGEFFQPLSIEITTAGRHPLHHIYTERQVSALRMGAVQPLGELNLGPGRHLIHALIRGQDQHGEARELIVEQSVEKTARPLLLEFVISDLPDQQSAHADMRFW